MATDYRRLEVWKGAKTLAVTIYRITGTMPAEERFNLASQIQRAAVSVVANIAEGARRGTDLDFARFVRIALGSLSEVSALLDLSFELGLLFPDDEIESLIRDLQVRLINLNGRLQRDGGRVREELADYDAFLRSHCPLSQAIVRNRKQPPQCPPRIYFTTKTPAEPSSAASTRSPMR